MPAATTKTTDRLTEFKAITDMVLRELQVPAPVTIRSEGENYWALIDLPADSILIGWRGTTLAALEYLIRTLWYRRLGDPENVSEIHVDIGGYKERQRAELVSLAQKQAQTVRTSGSPAVLRPMNAFERRIIHITLADSADVMTESIGTGPSRRIIIKPRASANS